MGIPKGRRNMNRSSHTLPWLFTIICIANLSLVITSLLSCQQIFFAVTGTDLGFDIITKDTHWTISGSPYRIHRDLLVMSEKTLEIDPGVEVMLGPDVSIRCQGRIVAVGSPDKPIRFMGSDQRPWERIEIFGGRTEATQENIFRYCVVEGGKGIVSRSGLLRVESSVLRNNFSSALRIEFCSARIMGNQFYGNSTESEPASGNGGGIVVYTDGTVLVADNAIHDNISSGGRDGGGGIYAYAYDRGEVEIRHNNIYRNKSSRFGGGLVAYDCIVNDNLVLGNEATLSGGGIFAIRGKLVNNRVQANRASRGGGIYAEHSTVVQNSVVANQAPPGFGGGLYFYGDGRIEKNTYLHNGSGSEQPGESILVSGNPILLNNNILRNAPGYTIRIQSHSQGPDLEARGNFWGTGDLRHILSSLYDWFDDPEVGIVTYDEPLPAWSDNAPPPPPLFLRNSMRDNDPWLDWEFPHDIHVSGFHLYWGKKPGFPYEHQMDLPIQKNSLKMPFSEKGMYHVCLTAYRETSSGEILESAFSEEVRIDTQSEKAHRSQARQTAPESTYPHDGAILSDVMPNLRASSSIPAQGRLHARWSIAEDKDAFSTPVYESGIVHGAETFQVPEGILLPDTLYAWRVSFQDRTGSWSPWTEPTHFRTPPEDPSILEGPVATDTRLGGGPISLYRVKKNLLVRKGITLTIEPGTTLIVEPGKSIRIRGRVIAQGEKGRPIRFTWNGKDVWGRILFEKREGSDGYTNDDVPSDRFPEGEGGMVTHCIVEYGKGIYINEVGLNVSNCIIRKNRESGITVREASARVVDNTIVDNESSSNGGGVYAYGSHLLYIMNNLIQNNRAAEDGGGVFAYGSQANTAINLSRNRIMKNRCGGSGGGVWASRSSVTDNKILNNQADGLGGGIYSTFDLVQGNSIEGNMSQEGGGIYAEQNSSIEGNRIAHNRVISHFGGGAFLNFWGMSVKNEVFKNNLVTNNQAVSARDTGGIYVNGGLIFEHNQIYDNKGYQLYNGNPEGSPPLNVPHCYWGTSSEDKIRASIFDGKDDPSLAEVLFKPFLTSVPKSSNKTR
jgi:hypothetical protein